MGRMAAFGHRLEKVWAMLLEGHKALPLMAMAVRRVVKEMMAAEIGYE